MSSRAAFGASASDELGTKSEVVMSANDVSLSIESNLVADKVAPSSSSAPSPVSTLLHKPLSLSLGFRAPEIRKLDRGLQIGPQVSVRRVRHRSHLSIRDRTQPSNHKSPSSSRISSRSVFLTCETRELAAIIEARQSNPPTCDCFEQIHSRRLAPAPTPALHSTDHPSSQFDPQDPFSDLTLYFEAGARDQDLDDGYAMTSRVWKCDCSIPLDHPALFKPWKLWDVDRDERTGLVSRTGEQSGERSNPPRVPEEAGMSVVPRTRGSRNIDHGEKGANEDHSGNASPAPIFGWPVNMAISTVDDDLFTTEYGLGDREAVHYLCADTNNIDGDSRQDQDGETSSTPNTLPSPEPRHSPASGSTLLISPEISFTSYGDSSDFSSATSSRYFSSSSAYLTDDGDDDDEDDEDDFTGSFPFTPRSLPSTSPSSFLYSGSPTLGINNRKRFPIRTSSDIISVSRYRHPQPLLVNSPSLSSPPHSQSPLGPRRARTIFLDTPYYVEANRSPALSSSLLWGNDLEDVFGGGR